MDTAVLLAQAYLHYNGYFTIIEYPVVEAGEHGGYRTATDIDIMAVRFPGAGRLVPRRHGKDLRFEPDPALNAPDDRVDLILAEVKHGAATLNHGARDPSVLRIALQRFGGAAANNADAIAHDLLDKGAATLPEGPRVRLLAFGSQTPDRRTRYQVITHAHMLGFLRLSTREARQMMLQTHFTHPVIQFIWLIEKALGEGGLEALHCDDRADEQALDDRAKGADDR